MSSDGIIGMFLVIFVLGVTAAACFGMYANFSANRPANDTYNDQFNNRTNATIGVETAVAPASIMLGGWTVLIAAVMLVVTVVIGGITIFIAKGGAHGSRR